MELFIQIVSSDGCCCCFLIFIAFGSSLFYDAVATIFWENLHIFRLPPVSVWSFFFFYRVFLFKPLSNWLCKTTWKLFDRLPLLRPKVFAGLSDHRLVSLWNFVCAHFFFKFISRFHVNILRSAEVASLPSTYHLCRDSTGLIGFIFQRPALTHLSPGGSRQATNKKEASKHSSSHAFSPHKRRQVA